MSDDYVKVRMISDSSNKVLRDSKLIVDCYNRNTRVMVCLREIKEIMRSNIK